MSTSAEKIAIWGYGREGRAALEYLKTLKPDARLYIIDKNAAEDLPGVVWLNDAEGAQKVADGFFNQVVKSPGVPLYRPEILAAREKGTVFTSGTNLWFERYPGIQTIAVTASKGKSTTSSLVHHALLKKGYKSVLAGNIGTPLLSVMPGADVTVIEMSSYQIADLAHAPSVAAVLNLYPAHGDWHGSDQKYFDDKMRLIDLCQSASRPVIVWGENALLRDKTAGYARAEYFSAQDALPSLPESLNAPHLRLNVAAALKICEAFGVSGPWENVFDDFKPLPHRQERLGEKNGVLYVNDSIATIPESTMAALTVYRGRPIWLLLGGQEKMQPADALVTAIANTPDIHVLTLPDNGPRLAAMLTGRGVPITACADLAAAVQTAQSRARPGDVVLLSPAAPSYGRFKNFEERGDLFRKLAGF